ncbi:OadG family transporter subunit [Desulfopila sp. IMCC35008]|uniref:OadG family transporter subunit n=1 Tax=Desulfopila sp. IMCC35008 TaxID=2653858 RepID=UPI0013D20B9E|nr:OadG family transporter subunit [Desulfopila sp. IMCC35008]
MILEGIKLMFVGMTTVVLFLILMIILIQLVSRLTKGATDRELEAIRLERELLARSKKEKLSQENLDDDIAAIAAAVAAYEAERFAIS